MRLDDSALQELHRMFAEECDPVADAQLAASAIYWAPSLYGETRAATRIVEMQMIAWHQIQLTEAQGASVEAMWAAANAIKAYVAELQALILACHAAYWVSLVQLFGPDFDSNDAVVKEMETYLPELTNNLESHIVQMRNESFQPTPSDAEALKPWSMALGRYGHIWVDGRERGVPESELTDALWAAPPILGQPGTVLRGPHVAPEGTLHEGASNMDALVSIVRALGGFPEQGGLYRVTYGAGEHHPSFIGEFVGLARDLLSGYPEPALRWIVRNPALPRYVENGTETHPLAIWPLDIEHIAPAEPSDMEQALQFEVEGSPDHNDVKPGHPRSELPSQGPWAAQNAERDAGLFLRAVLYAMLSPDASPSARAYATTIGQTVTDGDEKSLLVFLSALTYFVGKVHFLRDDPFHDPDYLPYSKLLATHFMKAATQCLPGPGAPREQVRIATASRLAADVSPASMALVEALESAGSSLFESAS